MNTSLLKKTKSSTIPEPYLEIKGGKALYGEIEISGAKNATLPAIVAACLSDETVTLKNIPLELNDLKLLIELLRSMGAEITIDSINRSLVCSGINWKGGVLDSEVAGKIRHSLLLLGLAA